MAIAAEPLYINFSDFQTTISSHPEHHGFITFFDEQQLKHEIPLLIRLDASTEPVTTPFPKKLYLDDTEYYYYASHYNKKLNLNTGEQLNGYQIKIKSIPLPSTYKRPSAKLYYDNSKPVVLERGTFDIFGTIFKALKVRMDNSLFLESQGFLQIFPSTFQSIIDAYKSNPANIYFLSHKVPLNKPVHIKGKNNLDLFYYPVLIESTAQKEIFLLLGELNIETIDNGYITFLGTTTDNDSLVSIYEPKFFAPSFLDLSSRGYVSRGNTKPLAVFEIKQPAGETSIITFPTTYST